MQIRVRSTSALPQTLQIAIICVFIVSLLSTSRYFLKHQIRFIYILVRHLALVTLFSTIGSIWNFESLLFDDQLTSSQNFRSIRPFVLLKWANENRQTSSTGRNWLEPTLGKCLQLTLSVIVFNVTASHADVFVNVRQCNTGLTLNTTYSTDFKNKILLRNLIHLRSRKGVRFLSN